MRSSMRRSSHLVHPFLSLHASRQWVNAALAQLRLFSVFTSQQEESKISKLQWRQKLYTREAGPSGASPDRIHPRLAMDENAMSCQDFVNEYQPLERNEVKQDKIVTLRGASRFHIYILSSTHAARKNR